MQTRFPPSLSFSIISRFRLDIHFLTLKFRAGRLCASSRRVWWLYDYFFSVLFLVFFFCSFFHSLSRTSLWQWAKRSCFFCYILFLSPSIIQNPFESYQLFFDSVIIIVVIIHHHCICIASAFVYISGLRIGAID